MKALIVEDKAYIRKSLRNLLQQNHSDIEVLGECASVSEAVTVANACQPELVFLDINLDDGTGFEFLEQTQHLEFKTIFITAYEEFALKALKAGAVDYILKPIDIGELKTAIEKLSLSSVSVQKEQILTAKQVYHNDPSKIIISLQDSYQVIELSELMYCQSDKGYTTFFCANHKKYLASKTLKEFEEQLKLPNFTRPHQSYIVNLKYIDRYDKSGTIFLKNGSKIPVSSRKKEHFLKHLFSWDQQK